MIDHNQENIGKTFLVDTADCHPTLLSKVKASREALAELLNDIALVHSRQVAVAALFDIVAETVHKMPSVKESLLDLLDDVEMAATEKR